MLTIEEIRKELDAGEKLDLECIDRDGFKISCEYAEKILSADKLTVTSYDCDGVNLNNNTVSVSSNFLLLSELKYFRIKRPTPAFDDLSDIAYKARKEGLIGELRIGVKELQFLWGGQWVTYSNETKSIESGIEFFNSINTETFVIDKVLFPDLKIGGRFSQNGFVWDLNEERIKIIKNTPLFLLKGATVTQSRGEA